MNAIRNTTLAWPDSVCHALLSGQSDQRRRLPVAWYGRVGLDVDADLTLTRQFDVTVGALPAKYTVVATFYDVCSGALTPQQRAEYAGHLGLDRSLPRDGGLAELLAEARRPDRRFAVVVCESIERLARLTHLSTKIEYELKHLGIAVLTADEGFELPPPLTRANPAATFTTHSHTGSPSWHRQT